MKITIATAGYWRSYFLRDLLQVGSQVELSHPEHTGDFSVSAGADVILWERQLGFAPPEALDPRKLFLFDYKPEGTRASLRQAAHRWGIPEAKFLLLFPPIGLEDTGPLPLPAPRGLGNPLRPKPKRLEERPKDVFFVGNPTSLRVPSVDASEMQDLPFFVRHPTRDMYLYNQRLEWVEQLRSAGLLKAPCGITPTSEPPLDAATLKTLFGYKEDVYTNRLDKWKYARWLRNSRIVLSPAGHSRWAYRHVESMFERALTVATDISQHTSLPQIPTEALVLIGDGQFNAVELQHMLSNIDAYQDKADEGYDFARSTYTPLVTRNSRHLQNCYTRAARRRIHDSFAQWLERLINKTREI